MNYTLANSSASGYQVQYLETDLTGSDFTKLNTIPLTIVPLVPDSYIYPIGFQIFHSINVLDPSGMFIGDLNTLTTYNAYYFSYFSFDPTLYNLQGFGIINVGLPNNTTGVPTNAYNMFNTSIASPIVLYSTVDSGLNNIQTLKIRTLYYILPQ